MLKMVQRLNKGLFAILTRAGRRIHPQLHIAISLYPADGILSALVVIFIASFQFGCSPGLVIKKWQQNLSRPGAGRRNPRTPLGALPLYHY
jgi:hypothetical protein